MKLVTDNRDCALIGQSRRFQACVIAAIPMDTVSLKKLGILLAFVLYLGCSRKATPEFFPAGAPMADSIRFEYAVYVLPGAVKDPSAILRTALAKEFRDLKLADELPKQPREMFVHAHAEKNVQQAYAPPSVDNMKYFANGVSPEQAQAVQQSPEVLVLEFGHPREKVWIGLRNANALVEEIAQAIKGLIWDDESRRLYSPESWRKDALESWKSDPPDVSKQMAVQIYQSGDYPRAISMGMSKFGLPDVFVERVTWSSQDQAVHLVNAFCQSMAEGAVIADPAKYNLDLNGVKNYHVGDLKSNATHSACLSLKKGKPEDGDPKNRLIELTFDRYPGRDPQSKEEAMFSSFFGSEDSITYVKHTDELLEASRKARTKLPELRKAFNAGLDPGEFIQVKAPFATPNGGQEWMWVEISSWKGEKIKGTLQNDPFDAKDLHAGQEVEVREGDVFDYIREYADKRVEGNTTGDVLTKMENQKPGTKQAQQTQNPCER